MTPSRRAVKTQRKDRRSQVDGLTFDFTENAYGFFYHAQDHFFEDDRTLAGKPKFLKVVRQVVNQSDDETSLATAFRRHPILHGRHPAFGTETNSTKAFALLAGVLDWLKPKAAVLTEKWQAEDEVRYAGSKSETSSGYSAIGEGSRRPATHSSGWPSAKPTSIARTAATRLTWRGLSPVSGLGRITRVDRTAVTVAADGQSYWAWCPSDTGVCFGIAGHDGQTTTSMYADEGPPSAPEEDSRWAGEFDESPPDWDG